MSVTPVIYLIYMVRTEAVLRGSSTTSLLGVRALAPSHLASQT